MRQKIIDAALYMSRTGLVRGTSGNISARSQNGFYITPSGMAYETLVESDIVEISLDGKILTGTRKPSIENAMHRLILQKRHDVNAVVHVHSLYATAVACTRKNIPAVTDNLVAYFGGEIPCAKYARAGSLELAQNVSNALGDGYGVLLSNHGALCVGATLREALLRCEVLEETAKIYILSNLIGKAVALSDEQIETEFAEMGRKYGQVGD